MKVLGRLVDIHKREIYNAIITLKGEKILGIEKTSRKGSKFIIPGLIDAHIHIESSMLTPGSFAKASVPHGTTGVVCDPHEIANVMGIRGIDYMLDDCKRVPLKFWFGAPSCVPATDFETSGGKINTEDIKKLLSKNEIKYLAEVMNFPGVIFGAKSIISKIEAARNKNKKIDGHAPGLTGNDLKKYIGTGISTDHECSGMEEAREKISLGMKILIREGSAARNLDALKNLYLSDPGKIMLCSDDLHPEMLEKGHINKLVGRLISGGYDLYDVIRSATINPSEHYGLDAGMLRQGENADFILVGSLKKMNILETWINGQKVFDKGKVLFKYKPGKSINSFNCTPVSESDMIVKNKGLNFRVIRAFDGELLTREVIHGPVKGRNLKSLPSEDILKIVVKDRYKDAPAAAGFIKGFGLKKGAFAGSVAHDSHNIIAIGTNDRDLVCAINEIIRLKGGLAVSEDTVKCSIKLDVAGIMSTKSCYEVASAYEALTKKVKNMGCRMSAPFMTLSFMALLVIPEIKLSDRGLFDGRKFNTVPLFVE
ncbi:MAG: adenine deaminase [Bacteroidetes bacterium RBG_13_43_22]|nr:MAG: adenine deaminase [Bacteroidetes bacterium RBG_13_43_22]